VSEARCPSLSRCALSLSKCALSLSKGDEVQSFDALSAH
jgi:hypothetical protein